MGLVIRHNNALNAVFANPQNLRQRWGYLFLYAFISVVAGYK